MAPAWRKKMCICFLGIHIWGVIFAHHKPLHSGFFANWKKRAHQIQKVNELEKNRQKAELKVFKIPLKQYFSYSDAAGCVLNAGCVCASALFDQWRLNGWLVMWLIGYLFPPWYFTQYLHELAAVYRDRESSWQDGCVCESEKDGEQMGQHWSSWKKWPLICLDFVRTGKTTQVCLRWVLLRLCKTCEPLHQAASLHLYRSGNFSRGLISRE